VVHALERLQNQGDDKVPCIHHAVSVYLSFGSNNIFFYFFIIFFLTCRCARHDVTAYMQLRLCVQNKNRGKKMRLLGMVFTFHFIANRFSSSVHRRSWYGPPPFSNFLFTNLFSIKFLYFFKDASFRNGYMS
jgi:hypothetical protein